MGRGRYPTPTAILKMRGSWKAKARMKDGGEPTPRPGRPRCPSWLDKEAKAHWKSIVPEFEAQGILARIDGAALTVYCQIWAKWVRCERFIQEHGETFPIKSDKGRIIRFGLVPQVLIGKDCLRVLHSYQQEFGMTPSSRTRIRTDATASTADEFSEFCERKKA